MAELEALREGATGEAVLAVQQTLLDLGFDPGPVDGTYGPATTAAVLAFQRMHDLDVDGIVGPITAETIEQTVRDRATL